LNRPELTNEKFIPNPFNSAPNARLYKTGDLARFLPNGQIECLGRIDYQVKVRGYRIELGEIEAALLKHPAVKEAVVVTKADIAGETSLVGYFVPTTAISDDGHDQISELRQFLKLKLPGFMVPSRFMPLTAMPLTANGKVDRKALPKIDVSQQLAAHYIAPRTELEQKIVDLWAEVMGIEKIGIHDNFFELGGHSILAIQVIARLRKMMQIDLPVTTLFALPTVADFADRIETIRWATQTMPTSQTIASDEYEEGEL
jgi:acyl carrier protein